jgi:hypothetical protein
MAADEMLDVVHYLFEDDLNYQTAEQATARTTSRTAMYRELYGGTYSYGIKGENAGYNYNNGSSVPADGYYGEDEKEIKPFDPQREPLKPFIPPTEFDPESGLPLGIDTRILNAPLN